MEMRHQDIRDAVRQLCEGFPGEYWREKDRDRLENYQKTVYFMSLKLKEGGKVLYKTTTEQ